MDIILITGASSGMGAEFARQLDAALRHIDEIWLIARRKRALLEVAQDLSHTTRVLDMDLTDSAHIERLRQLLQKERPIIRILVNSAGYGIMGGFSASQIDRTLGMIDVNCRALTQMTHLCLPYMKKKGRIIQLASSAAFLPQPDFAVYAATKAYVYSFSRALGHELRDRQIYVTAVCPGPVDTPFFDIAERTGRTLRIKKLALARADLVVKKAIADAVRKRTRSVYGPWIKGFELLAKAVPHRILLEGMRALPR